jgi:CRP/FNR family transcriptional regulator
VELETCLKKTSLFEGFPQNQLKALANITIEKYFDKGQPLFFEGEEAKGIYVIVAGKVKVYKLSLEGKEQILQIFGPGEVFGQVPVFEGGVFPASATAIERSNLLFLPTKALMDLIKKDPAITINMLAILSRRIKQFVQMIEDLTLKDTPSRLAAYLLHLSEIGDGSSDVELDITKTLLASFLSTTPETLSRILGKMSSKGLIQVRGRKIRLTDWKALEDLAEGKHLFR